VEGGLGLAHLLVVAGEPRRRRLARIGGGGQTLGRPDAAHAQISSGGAVRAASDAGGGPRRAQKAHVRECMAGGEQDGGVRV
jgi:hypothetical protein